MTNTLIPTSAVPQSDTTAIASVSKNKEYLPRIKLCGSQAGECQRGQVGIGNYALIKSREDVTDIGDNLDVIVVAGRAKAFQLSDPPIQAFDTDSDLFKDLVEESTKKDSEAMYGPEFLLYLAEYELFVTYFLCNPTGRKVAPNIAARMNNSANLSSILIQNKKKGYQWHGPVIKDCGAPLEVPDLKVIAEVATKFLNEKDSKVELADEGGRER